MFQSWTPLKSKDKIMDKMEPETGLTVKQQPRKVGFDKKFGRKNGKIRFRDTEKWLEPSKSNEKDVALEAMEKVKAEVKEMERKDRGIYGSHSYYNNLLADAMKDVRGLLAEEKTRGSYTTTDKRRMLHAILQCYSKYLKIYKSMDKIYDQMVHPQKRIVIRKLLDLLVGRLLELQSQMVLCENSETIYFDEIALIEGIMPKDLDMSIPKYYFHDLTPEMVQRDQWFLNVHERERRAKEREEELQAKLQLKLLEEEEANRWDAMDSEEPEVNFEDTVHSLQVMERARQGKGRYLVGKFYYDEEMRYRRKKITVQVQRMEANEAAIMIQKLVRGFLARHRVKRLRNMEMEFLGMRSSITFSNSFDFSNDYFYSFSKQKCKFLGEELQRYEENKRKLRRQKLKQFEDAQVTMYQKLQVLEGPDMVEKFKYELRNWMLRVREETGRFPGIPKAELGESRVVIREDTTNKEESPEKWREGTDSESASRSKKDKGKQKDTEKKEKVKKAKPKKGGPLADTPCLEIPKYFEDFKAANTIYNKYWRGLSEGENPQQNHEMEHIIREKRQLVASEIREQVDLAMKAELDYLKQVLEKRKGKKGKKGKGKGRGKGKGKKGKKKKGKDLTPDRTMESLFEELVQQNIIREYPQVRLTELIGQCSFINGELRSYHTAHPFEKKSEERYMPGEANPLPSFGDVLRTIKDICILPMGSVEVHRMVPAITKSVLICGPPGSGKKTIVNMICTELRATLVDLTASNIAGKYPGKPGLKMLIHLIEKVGRAVQPVIILIDNCEKTYMKKVPKTDKTEPKRLKKQIGKFLKTVTAEDLILLVGLSSEPWISPFKVMKKDYQRVVYIPPADFGTRFEMWKEALNEHYELLHPDINYTLLTKLSMGWTVGNIKKACEAILQNHRKDLAKQKRERRKDMDPWGHLGNFVIRPVTIGKLLITMDKLVESIGEYDPVFMEQEKLWTTWWNKTPLQRARMSTQVKAGPEKKKEKKGKKKKKK